MQAGPIPHALRGHQQFTCSTTASPDRVWQALTQPDQTRAYLYGLAAHSRWEVDSDIEFRHEHHALQGQVMHADEPCRLSYYLTAGPDDLPTYVTWQVRSSPAGSTIRLQVDETDPAVADTDEEAEDTWLPVLAALQRHLES
ncbi:MAG TPA: SRPBCC domain-containing protein [Frankiaceae bacterium]|nr:SRPBCC domain-containing protein [Frankiaceae bacterium]